MNYLSKFLIIIMKKSILITRTEDDEITTYCSVWLDKKTIPEADKRGFDVIDLDGNKALRKNVEVFISSKNPLLTLFHGHGNDNTITGHQQLLV